MALEISSCCFFQSSGERPRSAAGNGHHHLRGHLDRSVTLVLKEFHRELAFILGAGDAPKSIDG